ncbi:hypothetical protein BgiBS90_019387, partial [Biomphalaria glabrata]
KSIMPSTLNLYKLNSIDDLDCQFWSLNIMDNKLLCFGGDVSFLSSKNIGIAVQIKVTLADSMTTEM